MKPYERKLLGRLLELASEEFSNHGCNDFNLSANYGVEFSSEEIRQVNEDYAEWAEMREEYSEDELNGKWAIAGDDGLMAWFADRIKKGEL